MSKNKAISETSSRVMQSFNNSLNRLKPSSLIKSTQDAVEHFFQERESENEAIQQSAKWVQASAACLIGTATFAIGWLALAKTDEVVTVKGKLEPLGSVQAIQMPLGGIASEILVREGEEVKEGQIVMRLDAETTQQQLNSLLENQRLKSKQLNLKKTELQQYLLLNNEEEKTLLRSLEFQDEILARYKFLAEQGATAELQFLQQKNTIADLEGRLNQLRVDRLRQAAFHQQQIPQLQAELEDLPARIT